MARVGSDGWSGFMSGTAKRPPSRWRSGPASDEFRAWHERVFGKAKKKERPVCRCGRYMSKGDKECLVCRTPVDERVTKAELGAVTGRPAWETDE